ncbi:SagB family peptide dehydrogenase [Paenibacillus koleovorans]|uniref:SagB family peptide dehydrogenase n=1 Tax=Paenibacillus koleovorans TaxID=121608 RepID=UPI000FD74D49|nr:SagB family peptide dehydrogenase [Paenibacillus koleovorans]
MHQHLHTFLRQLQLEPDRVMTPGWQADWEDAPLPYKLYRGLPAYPLPAEIPFSLDGINRDRSRQAPTLSDIGHLLWHTYGLTQLAQSVYNPGQSQALGEASFVQITYRRFVPSGGGLYPNELYVYLKLDELPAGVYHYDTAHHRLILLREGDFDRYIGLTMGEDSDGMRGSFGAAFVSTMYWKNFFKYNHFSYRLQGLDSGVLLGQLLEVSKRFGFEAQVRFQFLDRPMNRLLGLADEEETVYAIVPLSIGGGDRRPLGGKEAVDANSLCGQLEEVRYEHYVRSFYVRPYPMLLELSKAAKQESAAAFVSEVKPVSSLMEAPLLQLPPATRPSYDLGVICRKRHSPEADFLLQDISLERLSALLHETIASYAYRNDLDGEPTDRAPRVSLYGCFHRVAGIADGAYRYDPLEHMLRLVRPGDHRARLQAGMTLHNVSLFQVPLTFHVAGDRSFYRDSLGVRGYRIAQMEAGMLVQRLLLAANALGLGGRPLLGFDAASCDELYRLEPAGLTSLIQIPVGPSRGRSRLEGSLGS